MKSGPCPLSANCMRPAFHPALHSYSHNKWTSGRGADFIFKKWRKKFSQHSEKAETKEMGLFSKPWN